MPLADQINKLFAEIGKTNKLLDELKQRVNSLEANINKTTEFRYPCVRGCNITFSSEYALKDHLKKKHKLFYIIGGLN